MKMVSSQILPLHGDAHQKELRADLRRYYLLFFVSGFPALLYQIVWQRVLFSIYGVNIESVTVIVTVFMLGLGLGSLAGGRLSTIERIGALRAFGAIELAIGAFGISSLWIFHAVGQMTAGASVASTGLIAFVLLLIPTLLMGSTLPLLVTYLVKNTNNVGESVGSLYAVNTLGSACACLAAAWFLMRLLGESGTVRLAAALNLIVGSVALILAIRSQSEIRTWAPSKPDGTAGPEKHTISLSVGMVIAAASGFIALAYEILWYRVYSFSSGGAAPCFAKLLGFYLAGVAYGSFAVNDACKGRLQDNLPGTLQAASTVALLGSIAAFLVGPGVAIASSAAGIGYNLTFPLVAIAAALLGAVFPLISHAAIDPASKAGKGLSYLYLSNIVGSAGGSYAIGFIVMDHLSTRQTSLLLLGTGVAISAAFLLLAKVRPSLLAMASAAVCLVLAAFSYPLFSSFYERLLYKGLFRSGVVFASLVENKSGVIAVDSHNAVYGGGVYDGRFNIDPMNDRNGIFRALAIAALHPDAHDVLVIGLSSGSWTQILVNLPGIRDVTVVEINPGYLQLIRNHLEVASLLENPKIHIVIDDGRRWLVNHPDRKFDFILMNTTYNWRANASNLLSVEFLQLSRNHLNNGGVEYYNTTESGEVQITGARSFPYALRVANFLAVSDSPIKFDRIRWREDLTATRIDGRPLFDLSKPIDRARLDWVVSLPEVHTAERPPFPWESLEGRKNLLDRLQDKRPITDDNMGTEWTDHKN